MIVKRSTIIGLFLLILSNLVSPVFALTNGPMQPEYMSFEPVDVTDMVNIATGDFTYTIPIGDVKGPAGVGYPIVLSYHGTIMPEQEATWVGLGWSLNVGSINRTVQGIADDAYGKRIRSRIHKEGEEHWQFNIGGGWGPVSATVGFSNKGFQGVTSFGTGLNFKLGVVGVNLGLNYANSFGNPNVSIGGALSVTAGGYGITSSAGISLGPNGTQAYASVGLTSPLGSVSISNSGNIGYSVAGASANSATTKTTKEGLSERSSSFGLTIPLPNGIRIDLSYQSYGWTFDQLSLARMHGYFHSSPNLDRIIETNNPILLECMPQDHWKYILPGIEDQTEDLSKYSQISTVWNNLRLEGNYFPYNFRFGGSKKDPEIYEDNHLLPKVSFSPSDLYGISGQGINGTFKAISSEPIVNYTSTDDDVDGIIGYSIESEGRVSSESFWNQRTTSFKKDFNNSIVFKMMGEKGFNVIDNYDGHTEEEGGFKIDALLNRPSDLKNILTKENLIHHSKVQGTLIEPLFGLDRTRPMGLSGFAITDQKGKTYYYTMPIYHITQVAFTKDPGIKIPNADDSELITPPGDYSFREECSDYVTSWLLTAITGPDYVKRSKGDLFSDNFEEKILPHQGDWGYWVTFRYKYGRSVSKDINGIPQEDDLNSENFYESEKATFAWRDPYQGDSRNPYQYKKGEHTYSEVGTATFGKKEITYLYSIETPAEIAYFRTSPRLDNIGKTDFFFIDQGDEAPYKIQNSETERINDVIAEGVRFEGSKVPPMRNLPGSHPYKWADLIPSSHIQPNPTDPLEYKKGMKVRIPKEKINDEDLFIGFKLFDIKCKARIYADDQPYPVSDATAKPVGFSEGHIKVVWDPSGWENIGTATPGRGEALNMHDDVKLFNEILPVSVTGETGEESFSTIPYAKCVRMEEQGDDYICYVVKYEYVDERTGLTAHTSLNLGKKLKWGPQSNWHLCFIKYQEIEGIMNAIASFNLYPHTFYTKKLDEIAFYSKAEYPYISPYYDPGKAGAKRDFLWANTLEYPQSYKRVKFDYNYDLFKGTPNSIDLTTGKEGVGGRLTLNRVNFEGGKEDNVVSMPPYMFTYGNKLKYSEIRTHLKTYRKDLDAWGYAYKGLDYSQGNLALSKMNFEPPNNNTFGIYNMLKKIQLPSCGSVEIEFERDHTFSEKATLALFKDFMNRTGRKDSYKGSTEDIFKWQMLDEDMLGQEIVDEIFKSIIRFGIYINTGSGSHQGKYFEVESETKPCEPGDIFILEYDSQFHTALFFRVTRVQKYKDDQWWIFHDEKLPDYMVDPTGEFTGDMWILSKRHLRCGNERVTKISNRSLNSQSITQYKYPSTGGVVEVFPDGATPYLFTVPEYQGYFKNTYLAGNCFSNDITLRYNSGNTSVMYPWVEVYQSSTDIDESNQDFGKTKYHFFTYKDKVTVNGQDEDIIKTEYVVYGPNSQPLPYERFHNFYGVPNRDNSKLRWDYECSNFSKILEPKYQSRITDRSGIVGQLRKIEKYRTIKNGDDLSFELVSSKENIYRFYEDLTNIHHSLDEVSQSEKPLGVVRELSGLLLESNKKHIWENPAPFSVVQKSFTEVITATPFLVGEKTIQDNVETEIHYGMFNAFTGMPIAKEEIITKDNITPESKLTLSIPYNFIVDSEKREILDKKNIYDLNGATVVSSRSLDGDDPVNTIADVLSNEDNIEKALVEQHKIEEIDLSSEDGVPDFQTRMYKETDYTWKGFGAIANFVWPELYAGDISSQWRRNSTINLVDQYTRPCMETNALGEKASVIYHPYAFCVTGVATNAEHDNCAVFTCDYDDFLYGHIEDDPDAGYENTHFDKSNNWIKVTRSNGTLTLSKEQTHFGKRSVYVKNSWGPQRFFTNLDKTLDYSFSAWVYPTSESDAISLRISRGDDQNSQVVYIMTEKVFSDLPNEKWSFIELPIKQEDLEALQPGEVAIISVGSDSDVEFYVDDIRFFPQKAHLKTFYYDYNLKVPITFVDENNQAKYFRYDGFGKLIEKGIIKND